MPYRMGIVRGDMGRGGFFGSVLGGLGKVVKAGVSVVKGAVTGFGVAGPIGGIGGAIVGARNAVVDQNKIDASRPLVGLDVSSPDDEAVRRHQVQVHNQQAKVLAGGNQSKIVAPAGGSMGFYGSRRTMQVTNMKALRRAIRRATGFQKLAMKTIKLISPKMKGKRFGGFKSKKGR